MDYLHFNPKPEDIKFDSGPGYFYFLMPGHPLANGNCNRVYLHRHLVSQKIGRWLKPGEHTHHLDGNPLNNVFENLCVVSPSEHIKLHHPCSPKIKSRCPVCGMEVVNAKYCSIKCLGVASRKCIRPTKDDLQKMADEMPATSIGVRFGVSSQAILKWCRYYGLTTKPRGYWAKRQSLLGCSVTKA